MRAKRRSTCQLCYSPVEPGEDIRLFRGRTWGHSGCVLRAERGDPDPEASSAMGYGSANEAADDFHIFHD